MLTLHNKVKRIAHSNHIILLWWNRVPRKADGNLRILKYPPNLVKNLTKRKDQQNDIDY